MGGFILEVLLIAGFVMIVTVVNNRPPPPCKWHTWERVGNYNFLCTVCGKRA